MTSHGSTWEEARRQKDNYDAKCTLYSYAPGDLVWYSFPSSQVHLPPKLRKSYSGPMLVVEKKNELTYLIQVNGKKETKVVHHDKLLPYKGSKRPSWVMSALKAIKNK